MQHSFPLIAEKLQQLVEKDELSVKKYIANTNLDNKQIDEIALLFGLFTLFCISNNTISTAILDDIKAGKLINKKVDKSALLQLPFVDNDVISTTSDDCTEISFFEIAYLNDVNKKRLNYPFLAYFFDKHPSGDMGVWEAAYQLAISYDDITLLNMVYAKNEYHFAFKGDKYLLLAITSQSYKAVRWIYGKGICASTESNPFHLLKSASERENVRGVDKIMTSKNGDLLDLIQGREDAIAFMKLKGLTLLECISLTTNDDTLGILMDI